MTDLPFTEQYSLEIFSKKMSLMIRLHLHEAKCMKFWQYREYASVYTKTLNLPSTKFPAYVKKTKRAEHDKNIREVLDFFSVNRP